MIVKLKSAWHKFPDDKARRGMWKSKILREIWDVTDHTRICRKHFLPKDYESERTDDKQSRRKVRKGELVLWKLKPDAVPSVWPGLPNHLTTPTPNLRPTTLTTSEARQLNDQAVEERREHDRLAEDSFLSLSLTLRLSELKD